jgi:hypothetical protein
MLRSLETLQNYTMGASDGDIGHVSDLYFDDKAWVVRYLVVQTGSWLTDRKVLISPFSVGVPDGAHQRLPVRITRDQVKNSPDIDTDQPVSRQHETQYSDYYGYPYYWGGDGMWGDGLYYPAMMVPRLAGTTREQALEAEVAAVYAKAEAQRQEDADPHLRSSKAVVGYNLQASDGDLGHVQGTSNWWVGHQVLIAPQWITEISWSESKVHVNLTQQAIKDSPRFEASEELNRTHEADLYRYYDRPTYWEREHNRTLIEA